MIATVTGAPVPPSIFRLLNGASAVGASTEPADNLPSRWSSSHRTSWTWAERAIHAIGRLSSASVAPRALEVLLVRRQQRLERLRIDPSLGVLSAQDALELAVN